MSHLVSFTFEYFIRKLIFEPFVVNGRLSEKNPKVFGKMKNNFSIEILLNIYFANITLLYIRDEYFFLQKTGKNKFIFILLCTVKLLFSATS